jgi:hypothetical protein
VCLFVRACERRTRKRLSWNAWKDRLLRCRNTVMSGETSRNQKTGANSVTEWMSVVEEQ